MGFELSTSCLNGEFDNICCFVCSDLQPGTYQFSVRTEVDGVAGPFSEAVGIESESSI